METISDLVGNQQLEMYLIHTGTPLLDWKCLALMQVSTLSYCILTSKYVPYSTGTGSSGFSEAVELLLSSAVITVLVHANKTWARAGILILQTLDSLLLTLAGLVSKWTYFP